jgi:hypothetical protein
MSKHVNPAALARTVSVLVAAALAAEDLNWVRRYRERRYEFRLLAAASQEVPELPRDGWYDIRHLLKVASVSENGELRLVMQAEGFAALSRVANRGSRLRSRDGVIDLKFGFDAAGRALAVLADTAEVRRALAQFDLVLEEQDSGADPVPPGAV